MIVGYSLSPGGLLLPYHVGALASLQHHGHLPSSAPLAGASAGAIAVTAHALGIKPERSLDATVRLSDAARQRGGAWGKLLPLLRGELNEMIDEDGHEIINSREGMVGLSYKEIFPRNKSILKTKFDTKEELIDAVYDSSTFPFFTSRWPFAIRPVRSSSSSNTNGNKGGVLLGRRIAPLPRLVVDGFFAVPRDRYGCPDFDHADIWQQQQQQQELLIDENVDLMNEEIAAAAGEAMAAAEESAMASSSSSSSLQKVINKMERTVTVCVFPHETVGITVSEEHDQISPLPQEDKVGQMSRLFRLATTPATPEEYSQLYEEGWADAERWVWEEEDRDLKNWKRERIEAKMMEVHKEREEAKTY